MATDTDALHIHKKFSGKITVALRDQPTKETLALYYTPGVAAISKTIAEHPEELGLSLIHI